jgi:competence CoiA-like predicted nuclease
MQHLCVHHHLGLGDHIICNGMIRHFASLNDRITLFCKQSYQQQVDTMFVDCPNLKTVAIPAYNSSYTEELKFVDWYVNKHKIERFMRIGYDGLQQYWSPDSTEVTFDRAFYLQANVPYEYRWEKFYLVRDHENENRVLSKLNPKQEPFIFVHDDVDKGYVFEVDNPNNYKVVKNDKTETVFNMIGVLEKATEIHCMESVFRTLIDHLESISCPLFLHTGFRPDGHGETIRPTSRKYWSTIHHKKVS